MKRKLNIIWVLAIVAIMAVVYCKPDWIVAGFPKHANALAPATAQPLAQSAIPETPITSTLDNTSDAPTAAPAEPKTHTIPASTTDNGMQLPAVEAITPTTNHRADGFDNMCLKMDDGSWTTVIYSGPGGPNMYPYLGDIDVTTDSPATAAGSQQWCADHASV